MLNQDEIVVAGLPLSFPKPAGHQLPTLAEWNQRYIEYVLAFTKGKKTAAARILGINRRTLYRRKKGKGEQDEILDGQLMDGHHDEHDENHVDPHAQDHKAMGETKPAAPARDKDLHRMPVSHQVQ